MSTYISLYVPMSIDLGILQPEDMGQQLNPVVKAWLEEHIGEGPNATREWYFNLDNDLYQWSYGGLGYDHDCKIRRVFYFKTEEQALRFKLAWW